MNKDVAKRILDAALALDVPIGVLDTLITQLEDGKEKEECLRALGNVIGIITKDFVFRIVRQYPELDPDK
jgi:hypothetical protein